MSDDRRQFAFRTGTISLSINRSAVHSAIVVCESQVKSLPPRRVGQVFHLNILDNQSMRLPVIRGVIDRRILANFRVAPDAIEKILPTPFRPMTVGGYAIGGICLIRLKQVRPNWMPLPLGLGSENAAHRIAVEWDDRGSVRTGVYIPRRDTDSWLNSMAGGRVFPGVHHHGRFEVDEKENRLSVSMVSDDGATNVHVSGVVAGPREFPSDSVFQSLQHASRFFEEGSLGYSDTSADGVLDGLELRCENWQTENFLVNEIRSSFFEDESVFPKGTVEFDCALLMRGIEHQWIGQPDLCCA